MDLKLTFLGANRQVTGSRYFLEAGDKRILIDCGMFQERAFLDRNWQEPPVDPASIDCLLLTHAHLDHSGLIPRLVAAGFKSPIYTTPASIELAQIVMLDAAEIQEEDATFKAQRHAEEGREGPHPVAPLYTSEDARRAMRYFHSVQYNEPLELGDNVTVRYVDAGHILGSASLEITVRESGQERVIVFSGDIGQWDKPLIHDPTPPTRADYVVMESTYGDRNHPDMGKVEVQLAEVINAAAQAGGNILIPTFALERAQELLFHISRLVHQKRIPRLMIFLDSPMAIEATQVMLHHGDVLDKETVELLRSNQSPFRFPGLKMIKSVDESKSINNIRGSCIIMAGSGMCTAGRIKHHLAHHIDKPETTVLFVGYQAEGTLGREIVERRPEVRILGRRIPVRAKIAEISGFSAHADQAALLRWISAVSPAPRRVFLTHGEESAALTFADVIGQKLKWAASVPAYGETVELA